MPLEKITVRFLSAAALGLSVASLAPAAFAANWVYTTEGPNQQPMVYYDANTIQRSGIKVTAWERLIFGETNKRAEIKSRQIYDCAERTRTLLNVTEFYRDGYNKSSNYEGQKQIANPIIPGSIMEKMLEATCGHTLAVIPPLSAKWVYVGSGADPLQDSAKGVDFYYDADTIQRSGTQVTAWEKTDFLLDKSSKYIEVKMRARWNCAERTRVNLNFTGYGLDENSETFNFAKLPQKPDPVTPDTLGEKMLESVCAAKVPQ